MDKLVIVDVVRKLVGNTDPVGESLRDADALKNTKTLVSVVDFLLGDIERIRNAFCGAGEGSVKDVGQVAYDYLEQLNRMGVG